MKSKSQQILKIQKLKCATQEAMPWKLQLVN